MIEVWFSVEDTEPLAVYVNTGEVEETIPLETFLQDSFEGMPIEMGYRYSEALLEYVEKLLNRKETL